MPSSIAIVSINRDKYSETFIQKAFDALPFRKVMLYGGYMPTHVTADWRVQGEELPTASTPFWKKKPDSPEGQAAANLRQWLRNHRPDAILCNYGPSGVVLSDLLRELQIPMIVHFHGYDAYRADILQSYGKEYPKIFATARSIIASSAHMQQQLIRLGAPEHQVHTCVYGIPLHEFPSQPFPQGPFSCLFVGRFVPKKRPILALAAMLELRNQGIDVRLRMIGEGELLETCRQWVRENGLEEKVEFLGAVPPAQVAQEMARAHVVLVPSFTADDGDSEGTPLVLLEAAACGRPVIAFRHAGIPDVVQQGVTGVILQENEGAEEMAGAIQRMEQDRAWAAQMGNAAASHAAKAFDHKNYLRMLSEIVTNAIAQPENP